MVDNRSPLQRRRIVRKRGVLHSRATSLGSSLRPWCLHLVAGKRSEVSLPRGADLWITHVGPVEADGSSLDCSALGLRSYRLQRDGTRLLLRVPGGAAAAWLGVKHRSGVDLFGYIRQRSHYSGAPASAVSLQVAHSSEADIFVPASTLTSVSTSTPAVARLAYNPLKPAAARASAEPAKVTTPTKDTTKRPLLPLVKMGGFMYEEVAKGTGEAARVGQEVEIKLNIRIKSKWTVIVERAEVQCVIGKGEVLDGWVEGNVDLEEVLGSWGKCVVGMQVGGNRRVHVPSKLSFKDGGGDVIPRNTEVLVDLFLKKLL